MHLIHCGGLEQDVSSGQSLDLGNLLSRHAEVLVGRDPLCHIQVDSAVLTAMISRVHASIKKTQSEKVIVTDQGSVNGTWCAPRRLCQHWVLEAVLQKLAATILATGLRHLCCLNK
jgi:hypothetical protein